MSIFHRIELISCSNLAIICEKEYLMWYETAFIFTQFACLKPVEMKKALMFMSSCAGYYNQLQYLP